MLITVVEDKATALTLFRVAASSELPRGGLPLFRAQCVKYISLKMQMSLLIWIVILWQSYKLAFPIIYDSLYF